MYKQESNKRLLTLLRDNLFYGKEQSIFLIVVDVVIFMLVTTDSLDLPILEWCCHFPVEFSVF